MEFLNEIKQEDSIRCYITDMVGPYPHWHDNNELIFVEKGQLMFYIENDDTPVMLEEGSLILIDPNVLHCPTPIQDTSYVIHVVSFMDNTLFPINKDLGFLQDRASFRAAQLPAEMIPYISGIGRLLQDISMSSDVKNIQILKQYTGLLMSFIGKYGVVSLKQSETKKLNDKQYRIRLACMYIEQHPEENPRVEELAQIANYSSSHFFRLFREVVGCSVNEYVNRVKIREAQRLLRIENINVTEVSYRLGFSHPNNFSRTYRRLVGNTPSEDRKNTNNK